MFLFLSSVETNLTTLAPISSSTMLNMSDTTIMTTTLAEVVDGEQIVDGLFLFLYFVQYVAVVSDNHDVLNITETTTTMFSAEMENSNHTTTETQIDGKVVF
jgi:hypothetical protein